MNFGMVGINHQLFAEACCFVFNKTLALQNE